MNAPLPQAAAKRAEPAPVIDKNAIWLNAYNDAKALGVDDHQAGIYADTELAKVDEQ